MPLRRCSLPQRLRWVHLLSACVVCTLGTHLSAQAAIRITNCSVTTPPSLVFVTNLLGPLNSATSFRVSCSTSGSGGSGTFTITLSAGTGSIAQRTQKNAAKLLSYNLYLNNTYQTVWGNGTTGTSYSQSITGPITNQLITIYGNIDNSISNLNSTPGNYADPTINLTLSW